MNPEFVCREGVICDTLFMYLFNNQGRWEVLFKQFAERVVDR